MSVRDKFSIKARIGSFSHAIRGLVSMLRSQHNAWLHALATIMVCVVSILLHISRIEWCVIVLCLMSVWAAEALNTAIELATDLISPDYHPLAGKAKDVAAGAVLITAIGAAVVAGIVFITHAAAIMQL